MSQEVVIKSRLKTWPKEKESVAVTYNMPTTLDEARSMFGDEVVLSKCLDSVTIDIQANVRRMVVKEGKDAMTPEQIQQKISQYKPSAQSAVRRTPTEKVGDLLGRMSAEEKALLVAKLQADLAGAPA